MTSNEVDNIRKVMGTLPSETPEKKAEIVLFSENVEVTLEDYSNNPYKSMFVTSTSTWGTEEFVQKWPITTLEGKLEVIKAVLTHNTLPQAKEMVQFVFRVKGVPRWLFDYHTQIPFTTFMSIGCRDNNKLDSKNVIGVFLHKEDLTQKYVKNVVAKLKDLYDENLNKENQGSWQSARSFLLQSYSHSYHFGQNLLSIVGTKGFHASKFFDLSNTEDYYLYLLYQEINLAILLKFPLLGLYSSIVLCKNKIEQEKVFQQIRNLKVEDLSETDLQLFNQL